MLPICLVGCVKLNAPKKPVSTVKKSYLDDSLSGETKAKFVSVLKETIIKISKTKPGVQLDENCLTKVKTLERFLSVLTTSASPKEISEKLSSNFLLPTEAFEKCAFYRLLQTDFSWKSASFKRV